MSDNPVISLGKLSVDRKTGEVSVVQERQQIKERDVPFEQMTRILDQQYKGKYLTLIFFLAALVVLCLVVGWFPENKVFGLTIIIIGGILTAGYVFNSKQDGATIKDVLDTMRKLYQKPVKRDENKEEMPEKKYKTK